jgi:uncharacterized GH25 family protein
MKTKIFSLLIVLLIGFIAQAHEFWMQPDKFFYQPGESLVVSFKVGENFTGEPVDLKKNRIETLELHQREQITDLALSVQEGQKENINTKLAAEGTYMVVMKTNNAFIALDGEKFNEYLKEDGLDDIYSHRERNKTLADSAREFYSRHTKLLIQCGTKTDDTFKKEVGLPIEIIPDKNPYTLKIGDRIKFKILLNGKPLFGAKVKVWIKQKNKTSIQNIYAQQDGMIETSVSNSGTWMVSVVTMMKSQDPKADWQSYWGSLVFAVK